MITSPANPVHYFTGLTKGNYLMGTLVAIIICLVGVFIAPVVIKFFFTIILCLIGLSIVVNTIARIFK